MKRARNVSAAPHVRVRLALFVGMAYLASSRALAASEEPVSTALAQTLFDEGRALLDAERVAEACRKFAQSQRLDPSSGTLLNLAICHEQEGKTASAWLEFSESWSIALRENRDDRARLARERMTLLEARLSRVLIRLTATSPTVVLLDGAPVSSAAIGVAIPFDPGAHVLEAHAAGRVPMRSTLQIGAGAGTSEITIAELPLAPVLPLAAASAPKSPAKDASARASSAQPEATSPSSLRATSSYVLAATGLTATLAGTFFGLNALSLKGRADDACPNNHCTAQGSAWSKQAMSNAERADLSFGLAGASAGVALYLWLSTRAVTPEARRVALRARQLSVLGNRSGAFVAWRAQF